MKKLSIVLTIFVIFVIQKELHANLLERVKRSFNTQMDDKAGAPYAGK
jgi:hypothetical protein